MDFFLGVSVISGADRVGVVIGTVVVGGVV